jgi:RimJ/RimL family protein N-acetyltransferase
VDPVELATKRVRLRAWRDSDLAAFARMNADPQVMRWFPAVLEPRQSDEVAGRFAAIHAEFGFTAWALEVIESERGPADFIGFVGLVPPTFDPPFAHAQPCIEIGWRLAPEWWGLGLVTEAARAALDWGLEERRLPEIVSFTVPPNLRSQAVMQRIGMHYGGVFEHPRGAGEWWGPHVLYRASASS